ncbi:MAG: hypothetical protein IKV48_03220 [Eggerthellaceae bacterium]|nr:hypothetical protein [Eggerthellaceae bacterium]
MISKTSKILFGGLLAGTLITGVGAGVAAAEYTAFEVDYISLSESEEATTEEIIYEMAPGELIEITNYNCNIVFDDSVKEGTIRMKVEYYPDLSTIDYWTETFVCTGNGSYEKGQQLTLINLYTYGFDDSVVFLEYKDEFLKSLKESTLLIFEEPYKGDNSIKTVEINPADEQRLVCEALGLAEWSYLVS